MISLLRLSAKMCLQPTRRTDLSTRNNSYYTAAIENGAGINLSVTGHIDHHLQFTNG